MNIRPPLLFLMLLSSLGALTGDSPPESTAADPLEGELGDESLLAADEELRGFDYRYHFAQHERVHPALAQVRVLLTYGEVGKKISVGPWTCTKEPSNVTCVKPFLTPTKSAPAEQYSGSWRFCETE
jgi:hypothetical protein